MFLRTLKWQSDTKEVGCFSAVEDNMKRACDIFCVDSGLLSIWDFSGKIAQIFTHGRTNFSDSEKADGERFQKLFSHTKYKGAIEIAVESPQGILRTPDVVAKFQAIL
ncbi:hypothetical protein U1Q18_027854 [Sarracenia purpurea var. burkii]